MPGPLSHGPALQQQQGLYRQRGWLLLPGFLPPALAAAWEVCSRDLPLRTVHVDGPGGELWLEQGGPALHSRLGFPFREPALRQHLAALAAVQAFDPERDQLWINRYRPGNRVPIHRDHEGDTQLLICLQGLPQPQLGGDLELEGEPVPLAAGDALLFAATRLRHGTSRIGAERLHRSGYSRVVLVLRLFGTDPGPVVANPTARSQLLESG